MADAAVPRIGFIGVGNMGFAILKGLVTSSTPGVDRFTASDILPARTGLVKQELGCGTTHNNSTVINSCDVILICVKPHHIVNVLGEISPHVTAKHLLICTSSGVSLLSLQKLLPEHARVIRAVPNAACSVGAGIIIYTPGCSCKRSDKDLMDQLLSPIALVMEVTENQINCMTAVTRCSPAFHFMLAEAMGDGAVMVGVPRQPAYRLAAKAIEGAARMVSGTGRHPGELKDEGTVPDGSTMLGIYDLEKAGMRAAFISAVTASFKKIVAENSSL